MEESEEEVAAQRAEEGRSHRDDLGEDQTSTAGSTSTREGQDRKPEAATRAAGMRQVDTRAPPCPACWPATPWPPPTTSPC